MSEFNDERILESYRNGNEDYWEQQKRKRDPKLKRYLYLDGEDVVLSTDELKKPLGFIVGEIVIDLVEGKSSIDGENWIGIEIE